MQTDTLQIISSTCDTAAKKGIQAENNGSGMLENIMNVSDEDRFRNTVSKWNI
jgi:hypothetical protein